MLKTGFFGPKGIDSEKEKKKALGCILGAPDLGHLLVDINYFEN